MIRCTFVNPSATNSDLIYIHIIYTIKMLRINDRHFTLHTSLSYSTALFLLINNTKDASEVTGYGEPFEVTPKIFVNVGLLQVQDDIIKYANFHFFNYNLF